MNNKGLILGVIALVAAVAALQWYHTGGKLGSDPLLQEAARLQATFPKPYVNGLVMEHAHVDGKRLVIDIRIPDIKLEQLDPKKIPAINKQEMEDLKDYACMTPELRTLLRTKQQVARRFLDQDRKQIFEIAVTEKDCTPKVVE